MSKHVLAGAAAAAIVASAPANAQTAQQAPLTVQVMAPVQGPQVEPARILRDRKAIHTRAEVGMHVQTIFARLDSNRDGFVTKAEAQSVKAGGDAKRGERAAKRAGARNPDAVFDRIDANRDGSSSRAEFAAAPARHERRLTVRTDRNADGGIERGRMMRGGGMGMGLRGQMFDMADTNRDGRVTMAEATAAAYRHFDMADANRDGQITREERMQMRQGRRGAKTSG